MKLTSTQIEQTLGQFEAEPIPEDHPMVPQLNEVFGEHTYFVNSDGLIILEPAGSGLAGVQSAKVVNLGEWSDDAPSTLELHEPETTDLVVTFGFPPLTRADERKRWWINADQTIGSAGGLSRRRATGDYLESDG